MSLRRAVVQPFSDRLDRLARAAYGSEAGGTVEALLDANPVLADHPDAIPAGTVLLVPERVAEASAPATRPWI